MKCPWCEKRLYFRRQEHVLSHLNLEATAESIRRALRAAITAFFRTLFSQDGIWSKDNPPNVEEFLKP